VLGALEHSKDSSEIVAAGTRGEGVTCLADIHEQFTLLAHSFIFRNRKALAMTETELRLIAAPAMIGLRSTPKNG
jgi:hypothetical protein